MPDIDPGLRTASLDYHLPPELVATRPAEPRDAARLLVYRGEAEVTEHHVVADLPELLAPDDLLVLNETSVARARIEARRATGGRVEGLFLRDRGGSRWELMLRGNGRLRVGETIVLLDRRGQDAPWGLQLIGREGPHWLAGLVPGASTHQVLETVGRTPLPPYIRKARGGDDVDDERDRGWYQTVFARPDADRSVAAPTAGLHFTPGLLERLASGGVHRRFVTLHVGPGTFAPVSAETLAGHRMHTEWFEVGPAMLAELRRREQQKVGGTPEGRGPSSERGSRLVAVGTTVVRSLESLPAPLPERDEAIVGETDLLIAPPFAFRHVDALLTNFHLPRSTLLALVAAMVGLPRLLELYREAVGRRYRFYSYGDAMLILP